MTMLLSLLLVLPTVSGAELKVCADPNNLPFSNDRREGFENRIVERMAADFGMTVRYEWHAQRRGNVRETLNAGLCDVIPGVGTTLEMLATTRPYYRSSYMFVSRSAAHLAISSLDDPRLRTLRIGVQLVGDDGSNTPPADALSRRGIVDNVRGYMIYGDYAEPDPQAGIVDAVASGAIDVALVWGPVASFFARRSAVDLDVTPITPWLDGPTLPMVFDVSMGVRKNDLHRRRQLDQWLGSHGAMISSILADYGLKISPVP
jgi:mxaJ protein